jgi:uncharacterized protein involved in exopolysaccharide biosynthesis
MISAEDDRMQADSRSSLAGGSSAMESPDVSSSPVVQNLQSELVRARARLAIAQKHLMPDHPQYQQISAEVSQLQAALNGHLKTASKTVETSSKIYTKRAEETKAALEQQREKVLDMNRKRDELALMNDELKTARNAFETMSQRLLETRLHSNSNQSEISVVSSARVPLRPVSPNPILNLALAGMVGALLAIAVAGLLERRDRRVRTVGSINSLLGLPVLAVLGSAPKMLNRSRQAHLPGTAAA